MAADLEKMARIVEDNPPTLDSRGRRLFADFDSEPGKVGRQLSHVLWGLEHAGVVESTHVRATAEYLPASTTSLGAEGKEPAEQANSVVEAEEAETLLRHYGQLYASLLNEQRLTDLRPPAFADLARTTHTDGRTVRDHFGNIPPERSGIISRLVPGTDRTLELFVYQARQQSGVLRTMIVLGPERDAAQIVVDVADADIKPVVVKLDVYHTYDEDLKSLAVSTNVPLSLFWNGIGSSAAVVEKQADGKPYTLPNDLGIPLYKRLLMADALLAVPTISFDVAWLPAEVAHGYANDERWVVDVVSALNELSSEALHGQVDRMPMLTAGLDALAATLREHGIETLAQLEAFLTAMVGRQMYAYRATFHERMASSANALIEHSSQQIERVGQASATIGMSLEASPSAQSMYELLRQHQPGRRLPFGIKRAFWRRQPNRQQTWEGIIEGLTSRVVASYEVGEPVKLQVFRRQGELFTGYEYDMDHTVYDVSFMSGKITSIAADICQPRRGRHIEPVPARKQEWVDRLGIGREYRPARVELQWGNGMPKLTVYCDDWRWPQISFECTGQNLGARIDGKIHSITFEQFVGIAADILKAVLE